MSSTSDKTESEVLSLIESDNDSDVEEMKVKKKWNRNDYFILVIDKWKCKKCDQTYNKQISGTILKNPYIKSHESFKGKKITEFLVKKTDRNFRKDLIRFIVNGNHAFNIVEEPDFKQLIAGLSSEIQIPSHQTIQREINSDFEENKLKLKSKISEINNKIALTTDIWTSMSERPYISITAHYVNANKSLSHILLDFRYIHFPHSGEQIMNILIEVFKEFEVQKRVIAITSDNSTNNISAIKQLNVFLEK
jgi:nucleoside diphosphate kinase